MEKKLNAVEYAIKVTSFRKLVRDICRKKGLEYPSDEKIAEWIEQGYGMENVDDFFKDYTEKEGIFREPITDFINEVNSIQWSKKPTEDEIKEFFEKNGNNIDLFCQQRTIASYGPLERDTLMATLKLTDDKLVKLWNEFIEESSMYGEDSYIYDLRNNKDVEFINKNFPNNIKAEITRINTDFNLHGKTLRFIQWHNLNDGKLYAKEDIKGIIVAYWSDIFERIVLYPSAYIFNVEIHCKGDGSTYFDDVFFPIIAKEVGYIIDGDKGTITKIEKK